MVELQTAASTSRIRPCARAGCVPDELVAAQCGGTGAQPQPASSAAHTGAGGVADDRVVTQRCNASGERQAAAIAVDDNITARRCGALADY